MAVALLATVVLLLSTVAFLLPRNRHSNLAPVDPPDVMAARAKDVLRRAGYAEAPADIARGFSTDSGVVSWVRSRDKGYANSPQAASGRPSPIVFWYRDSPATLVPAATLGGGEITPSDPPMTMFGMRLVQLDSRGQLLALTVVPGSMETVSPAASATAPDWTSLFAAAGLEPSTFTPSPPEWLPPFAFDTRASWSGPAPERRDVTLRVEAAAYRGRPIWFSVVGPWNQQERQVPEPLTVGTHAGNILFTVIFGLLLAGCVALARRNLRLGRGDRSGAWRLAVYLFVCGLAAWLIAGPHVPTQDEWALFTAAAAWCLAAAALVGTTYLALEPLVRRLWPHVLIGWSRVLSGKIADPLVGRDVLVGVGTMLFTAVFANLTFRMFPNEQIDFIPLNGLSSVRAEVAQLAAIQLGAIYVSMAECLIYVAGYAMVRRHWLAGGVIVGIFVAFNFIGQGLSPRLIVNPLIIILLLTVLTRFGLLALMAAVFTNIALNTSPITADFTQWYASTGLVAIVAILALAIWAFRTSLGGQPVFKET